MNSLWRLLLVAVTCFQFVLAYSILRLARVVDGDSNWLEGVLQSVFKNALIVAVIVAALAGLVVYSRRHISDRVSARLADPTKAPRRMSSTAPRRSPHPILESTESRR